MYSPSCEHIHAPNGSERMETNMRPVRCVLIIFCIHPKASQRRKTHTHIHIHKCIFSKWIFCSVNTEQVSCVVSLRSVSILWLIHFYGVIWSNTECKIKHIETSERRTVKRRAKGKHRVKNTLAHTQTQYK